MKAKLHLAENFSLPTDAVTQTFAILGIRGAGKSNTAVVMAEEMAAAGLPFVVIDPVGNWYGLRSSFDGKSPGISIAIFGGRHGDVPLERGGGNLIADIVVRDRLSCILDVSEFSEGDKIRFLIDFSQRLYRKNTEALHLFLEEADDFIPQRPMREQAVLLRAWENVVRRGRSRGLGMTMVTQRSAALNKNVLTQAETLFIHRTTSPQDRKAIEGWVDYHGESKKVIDSLPSLRNGEAWVWSPSWLKVCQPIEVRRRETFDSAATPKNAKASRPPATLADVDLEKIRGQMADTIERAKADDPKELKKRIRELEFALADARILIDEPKVEIREVPIFTEEILLDMSSLARAGAEIAERAEGFQEELARLNGLIAAASGRAQREAQPAKKPRAPSPPFIPDRPKAHKTIESVESNGKLSTGERKILTVLAQSKRPQTKKYVAIRTGYAVNGGGFSNYISSLRTRGLLEGGSVSLQITEHGLRDLGDWAFLPTGPALLDYWLGELGRAESAALLALCEVYPATLSKEEVAQKAGYEVSGGGFNNALSRLRTLQLIEGRGELKASEELFG